MAIVKIESLEEMVQAIYQAKENGFDQAIFAGRMQAHEIRKETISPTSIGWITLIENGYRMKFLDLPVYQVDADNYWRIS